jgi:hypothetical protein
MKKIIQNYSVVLLFLGLCASSFAQGNFDEKYSSIENELTQWDAVRGKWLGSALKSMADNKPIPDRTFPEDYSPGEMLALVPAERVARMRTTSERESANTRDLLEVERWNRIDGYLRRPNCKPVMGRSYGDPHLSSFDGANYSFQTVGEFVMTRAGNGQFEVQARQEPQGNDFSLNTAVAMNVGGDRVGIYANGTPNRTSSTQLYVNGLPLEIDTRTYYLPHGGTIRKSGKNYTVTAPSGERVSVDMRNSGRMGFMNVAIQVYPCTDNNYRGLLGNANGSRMDDFNLRDDSPMATIFRDDNASDRMQKERLAFLAKDFAENWRVRQEQSLFDYPFGDNTITYTDRSFPRVHRTINDMPGDRRDEARRACERLGLRGADLDACIFDNGYLRIPPTPRPVINDPTSGVVLGRVDKETPNVNQRDIKPTRPTVGGGTGEGTGDTGGTVVRPMKDANEGLNGPDQPVAEPMWKGTRDVKPQKEEETVPVTRPGTPVGTTKSPEPATEEKINERPIFTKPPTSGGNETVSPPPAPPRPVKVIKAKTSIPTPISRPSAPAPRPPSKPKAPTKIPRGRGGAE